MVGRTDPGGKVLDSWLEISNFDTQELYGIIYRCRQGVYEVLNGWKEKIESILAMHGDQSNEVLKQEASSQEALAHLEEWKNWVLTLGVCLAELSRRNVLPPPLVPDFDTELGAYAASMKRLVGIESGVKENPNKFERGLLHSGLSIVFSCGLEEDRGGWHMSLSRSDGPLAEEEISAAVQAFFGGWTDVIADKGTLVENVWHLFKRLDSPP